MAPIGRIMGTAAALFSAAVLFRLTRYEILEESMEPTLSPGDWVLALKAPKGFRKGDIVVFEHPRKDGFEMVKRVGAAPRGRIHGRTMPPDRLWVTSDSRTEGSVDSGVLGPIPVDRVRARILLRYKPWPPTTMPLSA